MLCSTACVISLGIVTLSTMQWRVSTDDEILYLSNVKLDIDDSDSLNKSYEFPLRGIHIGMERKYTYISTMGCTKILQTRYRLA
jgi:hypothetical protein